MLIIQLTKIIFIYNIDMTEFFIILIDINCYWWTAE